MRSIYQWNPSCGVFCMTSVSVCRSHLRQMELNSVVSPQQSSFFITHGGHNASTTEKRLKLRAFAFELVSIWHFRIQIEFNIVGSKINVNANIQYYVDIVVDIYQTSAIDIFFYFALLLLFEDETISNFAKISIQGILICHIYVITNTIWEIVYVKTMRFTCLPILTNVNEQNARFHKRFH